MRTIEDDLWVYFGHPNEYWRHKCDACRRKVLGFRQPVQECINCWKVEVWSQSPWFLEAGESYRPFEHADSAAACGFLSGFGAEEDVERLRRVYHLIFGLFSQLGTGFVAKVSKYPIQRVITGEPLVQYPDTEQDFLLMIYASSIRERDELRRSICEVLHVDQSVAGVIPVRRGCWTYEPILGPWQKWHAMDEDCGASGPL